MTRLKGITKDDDGDFDCLWGDYESCSIVWGGPNRCSDRGFKGFQELSFSIDQTYSTVTIPEEFI